MKMKTSNVFALLGAMALVSGATSVATYQWMENRNMQHLTADYQLSDNRGETQDGSFFPVVNRSSVTENDFTVAAEKTVNAVVGVKNTTRIQQSYQTIDPLFQYFFGNRGFQQAPQQPRERGSFGSGVIISSDGYIVTNNHVIEGADVLTVTLNDEREFEATLVGTDPTTDIALIKIEADNLPAIPFGESDNLKVGEWVLAVGNPFMLNSTVTAGIVSAKARQLDLGSDRGQMGIESFIQTDAAVNPGNSGGALVNTAGELVGINTAIYSQTGNYAGYSFAVPSSIVSKVVTDLRQYGMVQRAVVGIYMDDVTPQLAEEEHLKVSTGVYVGALIENGAAEEAGIQKGDVITAIGKNTVKNMRQFRAELVRYNPGTTVQITVDRQGKTLQFNVKLRNTENTTAAIRNVDYGAKLRDLIEADGKKYHGYRGAIVEKVESDGLFAKAGIQEGFLITEVNDYTITGSKDFEKIYRAIKNAAPGTSKKALFITGFYPGSQTFEYYIVRLPQ